MSGVMHVIHAAPPPPPHGLSQGSQTTRKGVFVLSGMNLCLAMASWQRTEPPAVASALPRRPVEGWNLLASAFAHVASTCSRRSGPQTRALAGARGETGQRAGRAREAPERALPGGVNGFKPSYD